MMEKDKNLEAFNAIANALSGLEEEVQKRTILAVVTFLNISLTEFVSNQGSKFTESENGIVSNNTYFTEDRTMSPKDFLKDKMPKTDLERIACLAYYLTHYRDSPFFKTLDLSTLNTEAAQPKFSNAALTVSNATTAGILVPAGKGNKQITGLGEEFVKALPDRDAAKQTMSNFRIKRRVKKGASKGIKPIKKKR